MRVIWGGIVWVSMLLSFLPSRWSPRKQATPAPRYFYFPKQESSLCYIYFFGFFLLLLFILIWFVLIFQFHFTIFFWFSYFHISYFICPLHSLFISFAFIIRFVCIHYSFRLLIFISIIRYSCVGVGKCSWWGNQQLPSTWPCSFTKGTTFLKWKPALIFHISDLLSLLFLNHCSYFSFLLFSFQVNEIDNRGSTFYLCLYWAQALSRQSEDSALKDRMASLAEELQVLYHRTSQIVIILTDPNVTNFNMIQM